MKIVKLFENEKEARNRLDNSSNSRFLSVDPLTSSYPMLTPYQYASNRPIDGIDIDGLEYYNYRLTKLKDNTTKLELVNVESAKPWYGGAEYSHHRITYNGTTYHFNGSAMDPFANSSNALIPFINDPDKAIKSGLVQTNEEAKINWSLFNFQQEVFELAGANSTFALNNRTIRTYNARVGESTSNDYRGTFFEANPNLKGQVVVHHAVEQQVKKLYPNLFTNSQMHSLENLRGVQLSDNNVLHLSVIRRLWNSFYRDNPNATADQILEQATKIDKDYGELFRPAVNTTSTTTNNAQGGFNFSRGLILLTGLEEKGSSEKDSNNKQKNP